MKWICLNGQIRNFNILRYKIDWNRPAPSKNEQAFKHFIQLNCYYDIWGEQVRLPATRLRVDFINFTKRIGFEIQNIQHENYVPFFHINRVGYLRSLKNDGLKVQLLELNQYRLVELFPEDIVLFSKRYFQEKFNIIL